MLVESTTPPGSPPRGLRALPPTTQKSTAAEPTSSPTKRRYVPDLHDAEVVKKIKQSEVELRDRNTVLRGNKPNARFHRRLSDLWLTTLQNFSAVRTAYADKLKKLREAARSGVPQPVAAPGVFWVITLSRRTLTDGLALKMRSSRQRKPVSLSENILTFVLTRPSLTGNFQPIIIISSSPTSLITMYNVKRFLQESTYVVAIPNLSPMTLKSILQV